MSVWQKKYCFISGLIFTMSFIYIFCFILIFVNTGFAEQDNFEKSIFKISVKLVQDIKQYSTNGIEG